MSENEIKYINTMVQAKSMLIKGLIEEKEFIKIEDKMAKKYSLNKLSLYRLNDLINNSFRVIYMIPNSKEVKEDGEHSKNRDSIENS